jgi:glucose-6-phosphate isomerase
MSSKTLKKLLTIFFFLLFFIRSAYSLAPRAPRWDTLTKDAKIIAVAEKIDKLQTASDEKKAALQKEIEEALSRVEGTRIIRPYWETLLFNPDDSFEIVMDYVDTAGRSNIVITRFRKEDNGRYNVTTIPDDPRVYNIMVRSFLGLDFSTARDVVPLAVFEKFEKEELPPAMQVRSELMGADPRDGRLAYLYAVTDEQAMRRVYNIADTADDRMGNPIRAVVVLGIGGQSLGNRAVINILGSQNVKFIFPDNMANPQDLFNQLQGIKPEEVLLYVSSKTGSTDETMANFRFFREWLIQNLGTPDAARGLIQKLNTANLTQNLRDNRILALTDDERVLLEKVLNRVIVSTTPENKGPLYLFAKANNIPVVVLPLPVEGRYTVLFSSGQFTTALAGHDISKMRDALVSQRKAFDANTPELNPALEAAMYAYLSGRPVITLVSQDKRLNPFFEWARQLINESLGKDNKGPYLYFASGEEDVKNLMRVSAGKFFIAVNTGGKKTDIPVGVPAIDINIQELNQETLARLFLFFEEFTVRYGTLLGVNPLNQPWVDEFKKILTERAKVFDTSEEAREKRIAEKAAKDKLELTGALEVSERIQLLITKLSEGDKELTDKMQVPKTANNFKDIAGAGNSKLPGELEDIARNMAVQLYAAETIGKIINPFFIYSGSEQAKLLGEFIKYLGNTRMVKLGGGVLWDYLIGTTDQHSTAQYLGAGTDIGMTTFFQFVQDMGGKDSPIIVTDGLVQKRLDGKTPQEVSTLYLEAVREALNEQGRLTETLEVPNENEENILKLYMLLSRVSELYSRLKENDNKDSTELVDLINDNESVIISPDGGVRAGSYAKETMRDAVSIDRIAIPMSVSGLIKKAFVNPASAEVSGETKNTFGKFKERIAVLAGTVNNVTNRQGSALYRLSHGRDLKEEPRPEFYAFRLEDVIAKLEIGDITGDTLWEEIKINSANTMIAKTVKEIKRLNPKAKVIVYTENKQLTERRIQAALDAIDSADVFDVIIQGTPAEVLGDINSKGWTNTYAEASEKTVFATTQILENVKSVIVPKERFVPFPELTAIMQAMLRKSDPSGKLPVDVIESILSSYNVWLELSGFTKDEVSPYIAELEKMLKTGSNYVISLPVPPLPKTGSVIQLLNRQYEEIKHTKTFA